MLTRIKSTPGIARSELARLLWPGLNEYYSIKKAQKYAKMLERRGLIEYGVIREGGRQGVRGCYAVGQSRAARPGYLGVNGWVSPKVRKA